VCASSASTGLRGGQRVTAVPTATVSKNDQIAGIEMEFAMRVEEVSAHAARIARRRAVLALRQPARHRNTSFQNEFNPPWRTAE
jgi:hypothetical protein